MFMRSLRAAGSSLYSNRQPSLRQPSTFYDKLVLSESIDNSTLRICRRLAQTESGRDRLTKLYHDQIAASYDAFYAAEPSRYAAIRKILQLVNTVFPEVFSASRYILEPCCRTGELVSMILGKDGQPLVRFPQTKIYATDSSRAMVRIARKKLSELKAVNPTINLLRLKTGVRQFSSYIKEDPQTFNLVLMAQAFYCLADPKKAFELIKRILKKDGVFLLIEEFPLKSPQNLVPPPLQPIHDILYSSSRVLDSQTISKLAEKSGFTDLACNRLSLTAQVNHTTAFFGYVFSKPFA